MILLVNWFFFNLLRNTSENHKLTHLSNVARIRVFHFLAKRTIDPHTNFWKKLHFLVSARPLLYSFCTLFPRHFFPQFYMQKNAKFCIFLVDFSCSFETLKWSWQKFQNCIFSSKVSLLKNADCHLLFWRV